MPETLKDAEQKQLVRVFDVFIFSPLLLYIASRGTLTKWMRYTLVFLAVGTIIYNGYYFLKYRKEQQ